MSSSQKLAIAAHLHVLLRRKTGRVTDTEWLATNHEYAAEIVRFARQKAEQDGHLELHEWADKLVQAMSEPQRTARQPLVQSAVAALRPGEVSAPLPARGEFAHTDFGDSTLMSTGAHTAAVLANVTKQAEVPKYVGGLR